MREDLIRPGNTPEELRHEYSEACADLRNHANLRFTVFTVYLAAIGGLSSVAFGFIETRYLKAETQQLWGRLGGLLVTLLFFYYELRIQNLIENNIYVATLLETRLKYEHFRRRESWGIFRSHNVTKVFFVIVIIFWLVAAFKAL